MLQFNTDQTANVLLVASPLTIRGLFMFLSCRAFTHVELMLMSSSCDVSYNTTTEALFCSRGSNVSISRIFPTNLLSKDSTDGWEQNACRPGAREHFGFVFVWLVYVKTNVLIFVIPASFTHVAWKGRDKKSRWSSRMLT